MATIAPPRRDLTHDEFLANLNDKFLACRQQHNYPVLTGGAWPKGLRAVGPYRDGVYELFLTCPRCGAVKRTLTASQGQLDLPTRWAPVYPEGYLAPKGTGRISKRSATLEGWRRQRDNVIARAIAPPKEKS